MTLWLRRVEGLDSDTMREIAEQAGVSWGREAIVYRANGIGYANGDPADESVIQDAAESLLGYRPQPCDPPPETDSDLF